LARAIRPHQSHAISAIHLERRIFKERPPGESFRDLRNREHKWAANVAPNPFHASRGEYRVEHPRWKIWPATSYEFRADIAALYGDKFLTPLAAAPVSRLR